jgi:hypothetical protein
MHHKRKHKTRNTETAYDHTRNNNHIKNKTTQSKTKAKQRNPGTKSEQ